MKRTDTPTKHIREDAGSNGGGGDEFESAEDFTSAVEALKQAQQLIHKLLPLPVVDISRGIDLFDEVGRFEKNLIESALRYAGGSQTRAARLLGIKPTTLHAKIGKYRIKTQKESATAA